MAKRLTDTLIWDRAWFRKMPPRLKETWRFLCDKCDHAGIWPIDMEALCFNVGELVSLDEIREVFGDRLRFVGKDKIFIPGFIEFQYKCSIETLNMSNKVHCSVMHRLANLSIIKPLASPLQDAKDKDKDKEQDKDKDRQVAQITERDLLVIYEKYPKKVGKTRGIKKALKEIKTLEETVLFDKAIANYKAYLAKNKTEYKFTMQFDTFVGTWRDWLEIKITPDNPDYRKDRIRMVDYV